MQREQRNVLGRSKARASLGPRPFRIDVPEAVLDDLYARLERTRRDGARGDDWARGTSAAYVNELVHYWRTSYDWRRHEARLNAVPQFRARVGDEDLHFVHVRGMGARPTPLLLLHGWPDTFDRFHRVLPRLGAFELVVPALPGFPFTGALRRPATHEPTRHAAELIWRLMTEVLKHERFAIAGGDGGSVLAQILAIDHPESVIGVHLTDLGWHATNVDPETLPHAEKKYVEGARKRFMAESAYAMVQSTRPRSLAASLNDSPVGLLSWIVDRFHAWSDGDLDARFSKDVLLTNVMLHWVSQTIGASMMLYHADAQSPSLSPADRVERPVGLALFPKDIGGVPPRSFAERTLNVRRWTEMPRGGHFAALEEPELYAADILELFQSIRTAS